MYYCATTTRTLPSTFITYMFGVAGAPRAKSRVLLFSVYRIWGPSTVSSLTIKNNKKSDCLIKCPHLVSGGGSGRFPPVVSVVGVVVQSSLVITWCRRRRIFLLLLFRLLTVGKSKMIIAMFSLKILSRQRGTSHIHCCIYTPSSPPHVLKSPRWSSRH